MAALSPLIPVDKLWTTSGVPGDVALSSAELSREISQLVSRSLSGETIDTASEGKELAARYPGLGMSGELIGKAIARAAGMMRTVLRSAPEEIAPVDPGMSAHAPDAAGGDEAEPAAELAGHPLDPLDANPII